MHMSEELGPENNLGADPEISPEIDLATVKKRAVRGVLTLSGRTALVQFISFLGFFFLTVFLKTPEIGLFFAISELVAVLGYFSDIGLAAALIQKKEKPIIEDIRSTFTIQQILVSSLVIIALIASPYLQSFYSFGDNGVWLFRALILGFFLASLKTIPSVLLERNLRFDLLVLVELAETLAFYILVVFLAWKGFGVLSYAWAVAARGILGVILIYILSPWSIGFAWQKESLKHLLKFGLPYQANTFLAVVKDRLMNLVLWKIIGADGMGNLGWAQKWAQMPLRFIMDPVMKVTFPAFSRMQENKEELKKGVEKTLYFVSLFSFPLLAGIALLAGPLTQIIPNYEKWQVALTALSLYAVSGFWSSLTTPLTNALASIGKIKVVFKLMIMWTALTWAFYPFLSLRYGFNGVAIGALLVNISSVVAIIISRKYIDFNFISSIKIPVIATLIMSAFVYVLGALVATSVLGLVSLIVFGGLIYFFTVWLMNGQAFFADLKLIMKGLKGSLAETK